MGIIANITGKNAAGLIGQLEGKANTLAASVSGDEAAAEAHRLAAAQLDAKATLSQKQVEALDEATRILADAFPEGL